MKTISRRSALKATAATFVAPMFIPASALGKDGKVAPSERVNVGLIGLGARCQRIATDTLKKVPTINIAAVSVCLSMLPSESMNVADQHAEIVGEVTKSLRSWHQSMPPDNGPSL